MVNSEKISHVTSLLRRSNLEKIRACYVGYSNDFDARGECRAYEERITAAQKKPRNEAWTTEIYAIRALCEKWGVAFSATRSDELTPDEEETVMMLIAKML